MTTSRMFDWNLLFATASAKGNLSAMRLLVLLAVALVLSASCAANAQDLQPSELNELDAARTSLKSNQLDSAFGHVKNAIQSMKTRLSIGSPTPPKNLMLAKCYLGAAALAAQTNHPEQEADFINKMNKSLPDAKPYSPGEISKFRKLGLEVTPIGQQKIPGAWGKPDNFVVDTGNGGKFEAGLFQSSPTQIDTMFKNMEKQHNTWMSDPSAPHKRIVVLVAHGGLVEEIQGMRTALRHRDWWIANNVYPINFVWRTGLDESIKDRWGINLMVPTTGVSTDTPIDTDTTMLNTDNPSWMWQTIGKLPAFQKIWSTMKQNAKDNFAPPNPGITIDWNDASNISDQISGGTLTVSRLAKYSKDHPGEVEIHLIGHSAGAIFCDPLLKLLHANALAVTSVTFLAPAIRVDDFSTDLLGSIHAMTQSFSIYSLNDVRETHDMCEAITPFGTYGYNRSLLYWVSRSFEVPPAGSTETPVLGMQYFWNQKCVPGSTDNLQTNLTNAGAVLRTAPSDTGISTMCDSFRHGAFMDEPFTMDSIARSILGKNEIQPFYPLAQAFDIRETDKGKPLFPNNMLISNDK